MEFPSLGNQCGVANCKQLDFLPFTCDLCKKIFCKDHRQYDAHSCEEAHSKDNIVPNCPLCGAIIVVQAGQDPNIAVDQHIASGCVTPQKPKKKSHPNACSKKGCKKKELIPIQCTACGLKFCLTHRFESDHDCKGKDAMRERAARAAEKRLLDAESLKIASTTSRNSKPRNKQPKGAPSNLGRQGLGRELNSQREARRQHPTSARAQPGGAGMSQDVALDAAIAASLGQTPDEDAELAMAIAASLEEENAAAEQHKKKSDGCCIS